MLKPSDFLKIDWVYKCYQYILKSQWYPCSFIVYPSARISASTSPPFSDYSTPFSTTFDNALTPYSPLRITSHVHARRIAYGCTLPIVHHLRYPVYRQQFAIIVYGVQIEQDMSKQYSYCQGTYIPTWETRSLNHQNPQCGAVTQTA